MNDNSTVQCDKCFTDIDLSGTDYFGIKFTAFASPGPLVITPEDLEQDRESITAELDRLFNKMREHTQAEMREDVLRSRILYLCRPCFDAWFSNPLGEDS